MRRAGEVVRAAQGLAVVRAPGGDGGHPGIGTALVDETLAPAGEVVDVFGPADRPFLAVTPAEDAPLPSLLGTVVYAREPGSQP